MANKDYYSILGIERNATEADIKKAYRKLAMEYHPDRNQGNAEAEEKFKEISEANSILSDPEKKQYYDATGTVKGNRPQQPQGQDLNDLINNFMGRNARREINRIGQTVRIRVQLTLEELHNGTHKKIKYTRLIKCDSCHGHGGESTTCPLCNGTGMETQVFRTPNGVIQQSSPCRQCGGEGEIVTKPCEKCHGSGTMPSEEHFEFEVPFGLANGDILISQGGGNEMKKGNRPGDLQVVIEEIPHDKFVRSGNNLVFKYSAKYHELALGAVIEIPTIDGALVKINIPEGTELEKQFRLQGKD